MPDHTGGEFSLLAHIKDNKRNVFYTLLIFFNNFAYGISVNIIGAVLVDLAIIYSTDLNTMCYIQVMVGLGYLTGSFASYLYRYINRQLALSFFVLLLATIQVFLPAYGHLSLLFAMLVANNVGAGAWDSSTSIWLVDMWPIGGAAFLQGNQMMYGLGSTVAPLLAAPFVYGDANVTSANGTLTSELRVRTMLVPFTINGALQCIVPLIFILNFFTCRYRKYGNSGKKSSDTDSEASNEESYDEEEAEEEDFSSIPHRTGKLALASLSAACYITAELGFLSFCAPMYQNLEIGLSADGAALVQCILSLTYTLGRLVTAFLSLKLQPDTILAYHYAVLLGSLVLLFFGRHNLTLIYIGNAALGFGFSAMWPGMFAFTETYLRLSDKVCSLYAFLAGLLSLVVPLTLAQLFSRYPLVLIYLTGGFILTSLTFFILVRTWIALTPEEESPFPKDDFYRRYSIAGPRMSMHFANFKADRQRRKASMAPEWWARRPSTAGALGDQRRKSTVSGRKKFRLAKLNEEEFRRKSTAPGF